MRAPLDERDCLSENCRALGAKFKRKVLLVLKERDLLAGRRRVAGRAQAMAQPELKLQVAAGPQHRQPASQLQSLQEPTGQQQLSPRVPQIESLEAPRGQYQAASSPSVWPPVATSAPAKSYPNNTLVVDLSQCHENLLPKVTRASARTVELIRACLPASKRAAPSKQASNQEDKQHREPDKLEHCDNATRGSNKQAKFPMPASIAKLNSNLHEDDYNRALCMLTGDVRYQLHLLLYRRLQTIWTLFSTILCFLIPIFCAPAAPHALVIGAASLLWLSLQAIGAALTMQFRKKLDQMLEKAVAQVNGYFMDHKLMLGVINVGGLLARARLVIPMLYFDTLQCREQIESILSADLRHSNGPADGAPDKTQLAANLNEWQRRKLALNYSKIGLHKIGPGSGLSFAQSQLAKKIILRYSQRWISHFDRRKLMFTDDLAEPRHLSTGKCLCQFIEEHFRHEDLEREDELALIGGDQVCVELADEQVSTCQHAHNSAYQWQPFDALVPTLSHLVSLKQRRDQFQLDLNSSQSLDMTRPAGHSSKLISSFAGHLQQERQLAERDSSASSATELSVSLELADSADWLAASHNDELMRKLKLLLEAHKSGGDLARALDSPAACQINGANCVNNNNCINYTPRFSTLGDHRLKPNSTDGSTQTLNQTDVIGTDVANTSATASPMSQLGKKFFSQADGIFCLGAKRNQQGVYAKQQTLEIC